MKLKKYIAEIDDETVMHIGSKSSYMFVGNKQDFYKYFDFVTKKYLEEAIASRDAAAKYLNGTYQERMEQMLKMFTRRCPAYTFGQDTEKAEDLKTIELIGDMVRDTADAIEKLSRESKGLYESFRKKSNEFIFTKEYIEQFEPFLDRKVLDVSKRFTDDGVIVIVDGFENGHYWMKSEFDRRVKEMNRC